jgi:hypothetical protein
MSNTSIFLLISLRVKCFGNLDYLPCFMYSNFFLCDSLVPFRDTVAIYYNDDRERKTFDQSNASRYCEECRWLQERKCYHSSLLENNHLRK